ncbi:MAG TPA: hypothetical protein VD788_10910 [Candidatus Polarisedimenticolaceae bacterium]|nr:hypothetical protein [Candidatus Polarisedimenticolaceae bacterium]
MIEAADDCAAPQLDAILAGVEVTLPDDVGGEHPEAVSSGLQ